LRANTAGQTARTAAKIASQNQAVGDMTIMPMRSAMIAAATNVLAVPGFTFGEHPSWDMRYGLCAFYA